MTGWRIGYIGAPEWIAKACTKFQSNFTSGTNSVAQRACKAAVEADPASVKYMVDTFASRREKMVGWINEIQGFELDTPPGAFYVFPRVADLLGKKFNGQVLNTSLDLSMYLLEEGLVSTVPGDAFGLPGYIRFSYRRLIRRVMKIEVANGEIIDKHTILVIKSERISDAGKLSDIHREMEALADGVKFVYNSVDDASTVHDLAEKLKAINEQLWDVEDQLRVLESKQDFGEDFVNKARSVYFLNDERAALKRAVNVLTGSAIVEAKSYVDYTVRGSDSEE